MKTQRKVILFGDSLILEGIRTNLNGFADMEIISLAPPLPAKQELDALAPDVIIFDLEAAHPDAVLALQRQRPQVLLVGVDLATDQMLVWSGEQSRGLAMPDLVRAIHSTPKIDTSTESGGPFKWFVRWSAWVAAHPGIQQLKVFRLPARYRTLALASAAIILCAVLIITLVQFNPGNLLVGTAINSQDSLNFVLAFTAGAFLGGLALAILMKQRK